MPICVIFLEKAVKTATALALELRSRSHHVIVLMYCCKLSKSARDSNVNALYYCYKLHTVSIGGGAYILLPDAGYHIYHHNTSAVIQCHKTHLFLLEE